MLSPAAASKVQSDRAGACAVFILGKFGGFNAAVAVRLSVLDRLIDGIGGNAGGHDGQHLV